MYILKKLKSPHSFLKDFFYVSKIQFLLYFLSISFSSKLFSILLTIQRKNHNKSLRIINQIGKQENQFDLLVVFILFFIFSTSHFKLAIVKEIIYLYLNFYVSSMTVYVSLTLFSIMKILQAFSKFASLFTEENQFIFYVLKN